MKLLSKIIVFFVIIFSLIIISFSIIFKNIIIPEQLNIVQKRAKDLTIILKQFICDTSKIDLQKILVSLQKDDPTISYILIVDTTGKALFHSDDSRRYMVFNDSGTIASAKYGNNIEQNYVRDLDNPQSIYHGERVYDILTPMIINGKTNGAINIGISLKSIDEIKNKYKNILFILIGLIIFLMIISTFTLNKVLLVPIKFLISGIEKMRFGNYTFSSDKKRKDEIGKIFSELEKTSTLISNYLINLKDNERKLKLYIDKLPNINIKLDLEGNIILANSTSLKCLNKSFNEIYGKKLWDVVNNHFSIIKEKINEALINGKSEFDYYFNTFECKNKVFHIVINYVKHDDLDNYFVLDGADVTEKIQTDLELKQRSNEIKALLDNLPGFVFLKDLSGKYIAANQKFLDSLKRTYDEVIGKTDYDFLTNEIALNFEKQDKEVISTGNTFTWIEEQINDEGEKVYFMKRKMPVKNDFGELTGIIGYSFDITQLKQIERKLLDSEEKYRLLVNNIPYGVIETDIEGNISFVNDTLLKISGYSKNDFISKKVWDFLAKDDEKKYIIDKFSNVKNLSTQTETISVSAFTKNKRVIEIQIDSTIKKDSESKFSGLISVITDITEKKRIENELKISEEKYRNIFEKSSLGIYRTTLEGELLEINLSFAKMFGYDSIQGMKESVKKVQDLYINPEDRVNLISKLQNEPSMQRFVINFRKKDGSVMIGNLNIRAITDEKENKRIFEGFIEDITEKYLYEKKLKEQLDFLQIILDTIPTPIFYITKNFVYDGCNLEYEKLVGKTKKEIIGKTVYEVFPEEYALLFDLKDKELLKDRNTQIFEVTLPCGNNITKDFIAYRSLYYHLDGSVAGILGVLFDISERKRYEHDLKQKLDLLDLAPISLLVIDCNDIVLYCNKGTEILFMINSKEIIGKNLEELLLKGYFTIQDYSFIQNIKNNVLKNDYWEGEFKKTNNGGKEIIIESKAKLTRDINTKPEYILIVNLDITERKRLENQLLLSQRLESLGTLASGIAHDLNNMLSPIVLGLDIIKNKVSDKSSVDWIKTLQDTAKKGSDLVKQILSFARGLSDNQTLIQLRYIISDFIKIIKGTFPKSINIYKDVKSNLWPIIGDSTQISQLLMNLCVNSRDAMPEGGDLRIRAENIIVDENLAKTNVNARIGNYVLLSVSDTGTGIPSEIISRIFDPFFTTKEPGKGTGLGLSTVYNIVKNHKGFITLDSELGKGTAFNIYLPAIIKEQNEEVVKVFDIPHGKKELILVVDDEVAVREIIAATLEAYGYEVISANNGAEAVALYAKNIVNVKAAIIDMIMPIMDGTATIQALKTINPNIKIIVSSGFEEAKEKPIIEKVDAFLSKPFTADSILRILAEVLNS